jgi:hypothetical protein
MAMQLHTYLAGINQSPWGQSAYRIKKIQHTPELSAIEQQIKDFQKTCAEKYLPAIEKIKKDFGWYLPADEQNENDYQIAYLADWYAYALEQPLKNTIFLNLRSDEQKIKALSAWEKEIQDFIQENHRAASAES